MRAAWLSLGPHDPADFFARFRDELPTLCPAELLCEWKEVSDASHLARVEWPADSGPVGIFLQAQLLPADWSHGPAREFVLRWRERDSRCPILALGPTVPSGAQALTAFDAGVTAYLNPQADLVSVDDALREFLARRVQFFMDPSTHRNHNDGGSA